MAVTVAYYPSPTQVLVVTHVCTSSSFRNEVGGNLKPKGMSHSEPLWFLSG